MNRKQMLEKIKQNAAIISDRYSDALLNDYLHSDFFSGQVDKFNTIMGTNQKYYPDFRKAYKLSKTQLSDLLQQQELFLNSKWSTKKGRKEIAEKQYKKMLETYPELTKKGFKLIQQILSDDGSIAELREKKQLSSEQIIDIAVRSDFNVGKKQIASVINRLSESDSFNGKKNSEIIDLISEKLKSKEWI